MPSSILIEKELVSFLRENKDVTDIVGLRIFPIRIPQNSFLPAIAYQTFFSEHIIDLKGESDLAIPRIQFSCFARTYKESKVLSLKVLAKMQGFRGIAGNANVLSIILSNLFDLPFQPPGDGSDLATYGVALDFIVSHRK